jgi:hypothetical protein
LYRRFGIILNIIQKYRNFTLSLNTYQPIKILLPRKPLYGKLEDCEY